jgi:hypothetical protein
MLGDIFYINIILGDDHELCSFVGMEYASIPVPLIK